MIMLGVENSEVQPPQVSPLLLNKDLFDAEDSDSDVDYTARSPTPPLEEVVSPPPDGHGSPLREDGPHQQGRHLRVAPCDISGLPRCERVADRYFRPRSLRVNSSSDDDEKSSVHSDDEEENESATPRQKSSGSKSKGAKSSIAQSRTRRAPKVDAKKIHSESQRIIRESDLSLPYHKPKPLSLNDFFSKKPSKTGVVSVKKLKGLSKRQQIAVFTQQQTDTASNETNGRAALSQPSPKANKHSRQRSPLSQSSSPAFIEPEADNGKLSCNGNSAVEESGQDISLEEENDFPLRLEESSDESGKTDAPEVTDLNKDVDAETENTVEKDNVNISAEEAESLNGTLSKINTFDDGMKEDAGLAQDEDENKELTQPAIVEVEKDNQKDDTVSLVTTAEQDEDADFSLRLSPSQTPTQAPPTSQSHRQKLLEASLPKLETLTPRLSGEAELVIDLGDADSDTEAGFATPCNPGLNRLMERFVKHTARSTPRPRKEVKLSVVSKETGTDGKEDLKLETVAVTIEGEVCEDPSLKVPGAKLVKLKEALQLKMKARREIERQRRKEAYRLDNEDYNEGEEGEMTDKSDTDDESDNDADGIELGDGRKEKKIKKNPFVNHEAVDDDDEDYDPEEDSDEYENEDDTDNSDDESDAASNHGNRGREQKDAPDLQIYSAETDEEDDDEDDEDENIKRVSSVGRAKKKKLVLDDDDDEEEEVEAGGDAARQQETENSPTLELHLDADDEEDDHEEKMNQDDSLTEIPTKNTQLTLDPEMDSPSLKFPRPDATLPVGRLVTESASSQDGTMDSCDIDKLGESIMRGARSPKKTLTHEEKTRDLFESASNTDGGTTGSSEVDRAGESFTGRTNFSWSAIKKTQGAVQDDSSRELPKQMDNSSNSLDTSFELMGSIIPAHQPGGGLRRNRKTSLEEARDGFKPFSKHHSLLQNAPKSSKLSELTLPVEDSQDLFRVDTPSLTVAMETQQGGDTQSFRFSYDDDETQTQFLDENGFLKLRSTSKPKPATKRLFEDENASQDQMDELLGLCSGKFNNGSESSSKIRKGLFSQLSSQRVEGTQGNLDELLGLCSGTFVSQKENSQAKSTLPIHHDTDTHSESSFHILSDDEGNHSNRGDRPVLSDDEESKPKKRKRIRVMDDEDSDDDDDDDVGEEDDLPEEEEAFDSEDELSFMLKQEKQSSKKMVSGKSQEKIRNKVSKDFFDEEAELSGSEYESDEDYDAEDMPDELEQDEADKENVGTEEQLREQVNKVHMKTMEDDDARRLRLYKEMYLPDGDLYSDGKGRTRQFRWRHIGDDSQLNLFPGNSDDEGEDEKDEDTQWRMERFQREQWLNEQKEKQPAKESAAAADDDDDIVEENSQFDVFMKTAVNRKRKADPMPAIVDGDKPIPKDKERPINSPNPIKFRHGSFLKRSKGDLAKIASMMKPATNTKAPRVSRNVLYQSITPQADEEDDKKPQLRRSASDSPATQAPKAKRLRLDRSQSLAKPNSIFSLM